MGARRRLGIRWLVAGAGLALLFAAFDWTWFRPLIQHQLLERSGRRVDFSKLWIGLDADFAPVVRIEDLRIENAPWASSAGPLIRAGAFSATFNWASLFHGERILVTRMTLVDAEVDLERQADGLRNWRLWRPEDRGPGRFRVLTLNAVRSQGRIADLGLALEVHVRIDPLAAPATLAGHEALPLTKAIALHGQYQSLAFDGAFDVSPLLSIYDADRSFALRGDIGTAGARVGLQGEARDLAQLGGFEVDLHVSAKRLADLAHLFDRRFDALPTLATDITARASRSGATWTATVLEGRIGRSDLSGTLLYRTDSPDASPNSAVRSPQLRATLSSRRVDVVEIRTAGTAVGTGTQPVMQSGAGPLVDARVDWQIEHLAGLPVPVGALRAHAEWHERQLTIAPLELSMAGGSVAGRVTLATTSSSARLGLTGLQLEQLGAPGLRGFVDAQVALQARGPSFEAALESMSGSVEAALRGATLPAGLEAKLGLDGGRWLRTLIGGRDLWRDVLCSNLEMRFDRGIGEVKRLALETENVTFIGTGSVDLPRRRLNALITPHRKHVALFALDDAFRVEGALTAPSISLVRRGPGARPDACCVARSGGAGAMRNTSAGCDDPARRFSSVVSATDRRTK